MSNNYVKTICSHMLIKVIGFSLKKIFVFQEVQILIKDHFILNLILKVTGAEDTSKSIQKSVNNSVFRPLICFYQIL
jgi:hypothetical protein